MAPPANQSPGPTARNRVASLYAGFAVEAGLGVLAVLIAWWAGLPLAEYIGFSARSVVWGVAGTIPMLAVLWALVRVDWSPIARVRETVRAFVRELLLGASWLEIAVLCLFAGVGEELLFRGVVQTLIAERTTPEIGLVLAGFAFGAVHFVSKTYFVLASVVGCYLGWLYLATQSLTAPIVTHALYDFVAIAIVLRDVRPIRETERLGP